MQVTNRGADKKMHTVHCSKVLLFQGRAVSGLVYWSLSRLYKFAHNNLVPQLPCMGMGILETSIPQDW